MRLTCCRTRSAPRRLPRAGIRIVACILLALGAPQHLPAQERPPADPRGSHAATSDEIAQWIRELDDRRFVTRRNATEQLIAAGLAAVGPIAQTIGQSNLEVATRGVYVLKALALSKDVAAQDAATEALQTLVHAPVRTTARQASEALAVLGEARQRQAVQELKDLGADIDIHDSVTVFAPALGMRVEIGPHWQGTVEDLQRLRRLPDVQEVSFVGPQVTDAWIRSVENLERVERVLIRNARITNDAVKTISKLPSITRVDLLYTPVNNTALDHLKDIKTLRQVRLYGTEITREAVDLYQASVAQVEVDFKLGAFLGVMCQQPPFPCLVVSVVPDSAAANGGIAVQDIIVRYGGNPIANFEELRKLISKNKVGDSVLIQVARGGTQLIAVLPQRGDLALGIESGAAPFGCPVRKLSDDGAAAKAGVRVEDLIVELNGQPVSNLEQLTNAFAQLPAHEQLEFGVIRNSRLVSARVTFGEWTESTR